MTHDLISEMLTELEVSCTRVAVTELRENTFYAEVTLQLNGREIPIDSRPSDALALAVRTGAPIFAAEDVITESAIEFEHEVEDTEEVVEKFKDFLDNVTPEDFANGEEEESVAGAPRPLGAVRQMQDVGAARQRLLGRRRLHRLDLAGERPVELHLLASRPRRCGGSPRGSRPRPSLRS